MLENVDLIKSITDEKEYKKDLKKQQIRLQRLQRALFDNNIGCVFVFEGWDAAGKGGAIKRVTEGIDPRGFEVHATSAPTNEEKKYHYLHRFWIRLPKFGKIGIFDRSWYGRVLVERVEKFASEEEWSRSYEEISQFEKLLAQDNFIISKFWFHISKDEQLKRFEDRQNDPLKRWKITEEDWRNREKWDLYEQAANDMLVKTNTDYAPWHIIEGEDKKFARVKTVKTINKMIKKGLEDRGIQLDEYWNV